MLEYDGFLALRVACHTAEEQFTRELPLFFACLHAQEKFDELDKPIIQTAVEDTDFLNPRSLRDLTMRNW